MKIFLVSSSLGEIKNALDFKLIDGVDFDLDLSALKKLNFGKDLSEPFKMVPGPCIVKASERSSQGILDEARQIVGLGINSVIKIPTTREGLKAASILVENDIPVCMFSKCTPIQVVMAGRPGGEFINLELPDNGQEEDFGELVSINKQYNLTSSLMVSGFTKMEQINEAIKAGTDIISISYEVLTDLV
ncbi:transaldolase family protein [Desulfovibrio gilichinskyi]|uniref:Transaldolase n=1 Tax=Desulfovibrio gilichinskyi TaxID=1519643 RepID=A0A1X7CCH4_9BACT|nr:transaldolase family protein [Desulfovibrio gilichinskyi]SME94018.1 transaldolase [Desulfovibrio gilichinskyi]